MSSEGKALPLTSLTTEDFIVHDRPVLLICSNTGVSGTVGYLVTLNPDYSFPTGTYPVVITLPTLAQSSSQGGASAGRAMKLSVSVINASNSLKRGGRVTYINSSQRLPGYTSPSTGNYDFSNVVSAIKTSPYRRRISGDVLASPKQLTSYPVDTSAYSRYSLWQGTLDADGFLQHVMTASDILSIPSTLESNQRPMSLIAYVFEPVTDEQAYSVTIRGSFYTRWPLTSVPGQSMRPTPTAPPAVINSHTDQAEHTANDLVHVAEGGLAATYGPSVVKGIQSAWGALTGVGETAAAVGEAVAPYVELAAPLL
jgi:hypothetical protein